LGGEFSSPAVAQLGGVFQATFAGADGWLYSFDVRAMEQGRTELLWKFDCNPKTSVAELGGRGTRNSIVATPVIYEGRVYVPTGQNPEHGEGLGHLWCIDPSKRGDLSPELVFNKANPDEPIAHKRIQACNPNEGDFTRPNPNSGVVWHYESFDRDASGKIDFEEQFHRTIGSATIHDGLLVVADFSGLLHCLDALTGKLLWTHDLLAACWSTPLISDGKIYIADEDGDIAIFRLARTKELIAEHNLENSVYGTPAVANETLFVGTKTRLYAIHQRSKE
jgi:outer membrane protein assembly factor BamB